MWGAPHVTEVDLGPHVGHRRVDHRRLAVSRRQDILRPEVAVRQAGRLRRQHLRQPLAEPFEGWPFAGVELGLHPWLPSQRSTRFSAKTGSRRRPNRCAAVSCRASCRAPSRIVSTRWSYASEPAHARRAPRTPVSVAAAVRPITPERRGQHGRRRASQRPPSRRRACKPSASWANRSSASGAAKVFTNTCVPERRVARPATAAMPSAAGSTAKDVVNAHGVRPL